MPATSLLTTSALHAPAEPSQIHETRPLDNLCSRYDSFRRALFRLAVDVWHVRRSARRSSSNLSTRPTWPARAVAAAQAIRRNSAHKAFQAQGAILNALAVAEGQPNYEFAKLLKEHLRGLPAAFPETPVSEVHRVVNLIQRL